MGAAKGFGGSLAMAPGVVGGSATGMGGASGFLAAPTLATAGGAGGIGAQLGTAAGLGSLGGGATMMGPGLLASLMTPENLNKAYQTYKMLNPQKQAQGGRSPPPVMMQQPGPSESFIDTYRRRR